MRGENSKRLAVEWFLRAQDDEKAAESLLRNKGPFSVICFHSQQMAEKYLKGYLVFNKKKIEKIHDLGKILRRCQAIDKNFKKLSENCKFLNRYYVATRYPGNFFEGISDKEARQAFEKAKEIKDFVLNKIS